MHLYATPELHDSIFIKQPFIPITQLGHLQRVLPWVQYPHIHEDEYEISYIAKGQGFLHLPGYLLPLQENAVTIIPPQIAHCYTDATENQSSLEYYVLRFRGAVSGSFLQKELQELQTATVINPEYISLIQTLMDTILRSPGASGGKIDEFAQTAALSILQLTAEAFRQDRHVIPISMPVYANDILRYLQNHIEQKVTMEDLSREFNLSQSHIFRVFMKTYHTSPINYLIYCRMREARTYILNQNMKSDEIARRLAFHNPYHFINTFTKFYGCHPDQYREEAPEFKIH